MVFNSIKANLHASRRAPLNPMFSKRSIAKFEPFLKGRVELMCKRLSVAKESGEVLNLIDVFSAFTGDAIMEYCFGFYDNQLESPGFKANPHQALVNPTSFGSLTVQFPLINPVSNYNSITPS
jgi:cytochrome P450